jgi:hypothetical protein
MHAAKNLTAQPRIRYFSYGSIILFGLFSLDGLNVPIVSARRNFPLGLKKVPFTHPVSATPEPCIPSNFATFPQLTD